MFTKRKYGELIEACAFVSLVCLVISCIALVTPEWVDARARVLNEIEDVGDSTINYGLWQGTLIRRITLSPRSYDIRVTCIWGENKCAWSCRESSDARSNEIQLLVDGQKPPFDCQPISTFRSLGGSLNKQTNDTNTGEFLNAGMYMSSLLFVIVTILLYLVCLGLGAVNCLMSPSESLINTQGMKFVAIAAFITHLAALIFYGCLFNFWIEDNVGILDTIVGEYKSYASLGYSYWIFMFACVFHVLIVGLVMFRDNRLRGDRAETVIVVAQINDPTTVLY